MRASQTTRADATLPFELMAIALPRDDRNSSIVARHYGLDGNGGANFSRIGEEFGLTRERVRQIVAGIDPRCYLRPCAVPPLERDIGADCIELAGACLRHGNHLTGRRADSQGISPGRNNEDCGTP